MSACDGFGDFGGTFDNAFGDISQTISDQLVGFNPLGAEAIAIGRATPIIAGNNFTSGGDHGIRLNFSYDFRLAGRQGGEIDNKPTESWLFIDHCLENAEDYLQFHLVEGGNLEGFGKGESFFVDRAGVTTQNFSVGANVTPPPPIVSQYMAFIQGEGHPVPKEFLLRRMTESLDRDGLGHRVDIVYIEDVLRAGYTCEDIGNLLVPSSDAIKSYIEAFKKRSERSFAIVG